MCLAHRGEIYKPEKPYDEDWPEYDYLTPAVDSCLPVRDETTGLKKEMDVIDCWVCDKDGNICPGYGSSPVPVIVDNMGKYVGERE